MAFHLLQHKRHKGLHLAACLEQAMNTIVRCQQCNNFSEDETCSLCLDQARTKSILCVVDNPADISAIEQTGAYQGQYFVLMGKISPLDGIGPNDVGLPKLKELVLSKEISEVILALSPSVESQTTAHFIHQLLHQHEVNISQLAHGIPFGGELEFLDGNTIGNALRNRAIINV